MGNPIQGNPQKGVNCYTTTEYAADPVTHYAEYDHMIGIKYCSCKKLVAKS